MSSLAWALQEVGGSIGHAMEAARRDGDYDTVEDLGALARELERVERSVAFRRRRSLEAVGS